MKADYNVQVEWLAFDLRPNTPPEGIPRTDPPGEKRVGLPVDGHLGEMAQEAGIIMRRPPIVAYTRSSMEVGELAKAQGKFDDYHLGALKAYWEDGKNIGDLKVLQEIGAHAGLDPAEIAEVLQDRRYAQAVQGQVDFAHQIGITGIPAYIVGRYLFTGAQQYDFFKMVADKVLAEHEEPKS